MTGLTIVNLDVFYTTDILHAYLIDTGKDIPTAADIISVYPNGSDETKWRLMNDYRSNIYFNPIVGEQEESLNKQPWVKIGTRPETVENQAQLRWNIMSSSYGQLDWEYIVQESDRDDDQGFNAIALYGGEEGSEVLLSFGYLESKIPYSLVNSIHVRFSVQIESESRGIIIELYLKYQEHAIDTLSTGIIGMHPNLKDYGLSTSLVDQDSVDSYSQLRSNKIIELGEPDYTSIIENFQVKDSTLFSKLSDYRLTQGYFQPLMPLDYIFNNLKNQLGNNFSYSIKSGSNVYQMDYTKDALIRRLSISIDNYYGPQMILYERNFIVVVSSWLNPSIQFIFFNNGELDIPSNLEIRCDNLIHTYFNGLVIQTNSGAVIIQPPANWDTVEIDGVTYKVSAQKVNLEYHTDKYVPVNFDLGNIFATLTNTADKFYYENMYSSRTSRDYDFNSLVDLYSCNNEQQLAIQQAESLLNLEVLNYLELKDRRPIGIDAGLLCLDNDFIRLYVNSVNISTSRYFEIPYPTIDDTKVTTGVIFSNNRELYYQSNYELATPSTTLLKWVIGESTSWTAVDGYPSSTNKVFRAFRGLEIELDTSNIGVVRK